MSSTASAVPSRANPESPAVAAAEARTAGARAGGLFTATAGDVMTRDFAVCAPEPLLSGVLVTMHERELVRVLVVDKDNTLLGVVNARDGLRALLAAGKHEEELLRNDVMGISHP